MMESLLSLNQVHSMEFIAIPLCVMPIFTAIMVLNQLKNFARRDYFSMARPAIFRIECNVKLNVIMVRVFNGSIFFVMAH